MTRQPRRCIDSKDCIATPSNKIQPPGDQLVTIIGDEHATHMPRDFVAFRLCLRRIKKSTGHRQQCTQNNSSSPSTLKCFTERWLPQLFDNDVWNDACSSFVTSSGFLIHLELSVLSIGTELILKIIELLLIELLRLPKNRSTVDCTFIFQYLFNLFYHFFVF